MMKEAALLLMMMMVAPQVPPSLANPRECQENEYLDERGQCNPCRECGPGLELSKECGYGEGSQAQCVPCHPRRFKDQWGHHGCKPCLSCALINRVQRANCTSTSDAACGECLPGFYSKTQIGGLRDLECVPCTKQTPFSELQCHSKVNLEQVESPPTSAHELPLVVLTTMALVIIMLVVMTVSILYCQRFWKDRCQRVFGRSQNFPEQRVTFQPPVIIPAGFSCRETVLSLPCLHTKSSNPRHQSADDPVEVVQHVLDAEALERRLPGGLPDVELSRLIALNPKAPLAGNLVEVQPLIRNSGCSDCSAGGSSISEFRLDPGGDPTCPALQPSCATEVEHRWPHAPVECTELDLQKFSTQREFVDTPRKGIAERDLGNSLEVMPEAPAYSVSMRKSSSLDSIQDSAVSFRNPVVESGGQMGEDVQSLVTKIGDLARDVPIGSLPDPLVMSLAFHLNPHLAGLNVFHLGISGFTELVAYLADSGDPLPVATLAKVLEKFQCFDALRLLYGHLTGSQTQNFQL